MQRIEDEVRGDENKKMKKKIDFDFISLPPLDYLCIGSIYRLHYYRWSLKFETVGGYN